MKVFISGIIQGSNKGKGIQGQGYRQTIINAVSDRHPEAEILDPVTLFPDSVEYDTQRAKQVLFELADLAASTDLLIAFLPEASMGTALEMMRAYDNGKAIVTISNMEKNWFINAVSDKILPSLDAFCDWVQHTNLAELVGTGKGA
jgi:hypothetical protein